MRTLTDIPVSRPLPVLDRSWGDGPIVGDGYAYRTPITMAQAQEIANYMCMWMCWGIRIPITTSARSTVRRHGTFYWFQKRIDGRLYFSNPKIILYDFSLGVLLHELSHYVNFIRSENCNHNYHFHEMQKRFTMRSTI